MRSRISWSAITSTKMGVTAVTAIALTFATVLATAGGAGPATDDANKSDSATKAESPKPKPQEFGVLINDSRAFPGYNLINPGRKQTFLYDNEGRVVHSWTSEHPSGAAAYILDNGHLFRPSEVVNRKPGFQGPAASGRFQEFDWDGNLVWEFEYHSEKRLPHHDAIKLPNGNVLAICWERIEEKEAIAAGRRPETVQGSHLQPDCLVEIKPTGKKTGEIVWEWRSWDHLIQDREKNKPNYGSISQHPELFDLNYIHGEEGQVAKMMTTKDGLAKLRSLGYVGAGAAAPADTKKDSPKKDASKDDASKAQSKDVQKKDQPRAPRKNPDWMHVNAVAYNAELDQIALSSPSFHEIWIIDHSTTREEAKGHTGGRWGKGGDILYRWGNPRAYRNGTSLEQRLFGQHNIQWIPKGLSGEGHLLVFNNGGGRKPVEYSSVDEFVPPTSKDGNYTRPKRGPFGPAQPIWSYTASNKKDFYSWFISGAQRLPNGNTLINAGAVGIVFEVTPESETVWKFANPFKPVTGAPPAAGGPQRRFEAIASAARDSLGVTKDQRKKLDEIDTELIAKLDKVLTAEQIKSFAAPNPNDYADLVKRPQGEYLAVFDRSTPKVTDAQRKELKALQKDFSPKIAKVFTDAQKTLIADFKKGQVAAAAGRGGPPRMGNTLFRATRYALDHPAFAGRTLKPGKTLVELQQELDKPQPKKETSPEKLKTVNTSD
jgi:Arylsulfotransferase (ASST)